MNILSKRYLLSSIVLCVCLISLMTSCSHKDEKEIEDEQASGIVLIQNRSFYEVKLPNDESLYFTRYDDEDGIQGLATNPDSVEVASGYGTGFFVGHDGLIATNAHVISNLTDDKDIQKSMGSFINVLKQLVSDEYDEKSELLDKLNDAYDYANYSPDISISDFIMIKNARQEVIDEMDDLKDTYRTLDKMHGSDCEVIYHNEVSIAYNDTHVTNNDDFSGCVIRDMDTENDVALIQLKNKKTPEDKYVFVVAEEDPYEYYSFSDKIKSKLSGDKNNKMFVHGFNMGPILGETKEGLRAQFTSGSVSQCTSDELMYTIPTLSGSSGSPVVNMEGELVAINSAKLKDTQSFNFGVRIKHLKHLMEKSR